MSLRLRPSIELYVGSVDGNRKFVIFSLGANSSVLALSSESELSELRYICLNGVSQSTSRLSQWLLANGLLEEISERDFRRTIESPLSREIVSRTVGMSVKQSQLVQNRLGEASVAIIGLGGLGSHIIQHLSRIGVSRFDLVDFDLIEESNLNRQVLYDFRDIGKLKTDCAVHSIKSVNPNAHVCVQNDIEKYLLTAKGGVSIVFVTADSDYYDLRRDIITWCWNTGTPYIFAGYTGSMVRIHPAVTSFSSGCGICLQKKLECEVKYEKVPIGHEQGFIAPSGYAVNAIGGVLAAQRWFAQLAGEIEIDYSLDFDTTKMTRAKYFPARLDGCQICGSQ